MLRIQTVMLVACGLAGCSPTVEESATETSATRAIATTQTTSPHQLRQLTTDHLPNAVQVHSRVISGGLPEGDAAFEELRNLGVRTIISVDGATPDVATAARHGLRYVHLPHGYDGIPDQRARELAKAVRELEGVVYVHCHHGKHRSPAAASVACVTAGLLAPSRAVAVLEFAGTSPNYRGLYHSASVARPLEASLLANLQVAFHERVAVPPMAEAMVAIERSHDHLEQIAAAGWQAPAGHPDLDPAHEALMLQEHFKELLRTDDVQQKPARFRELLEDSAVAARDLADQLRAPKSSATPPAVRRLSARFSENCRTCHQQFRDIPLADKPDPAISGDLD